MPARSGLTRSRYLILAVSAIGILTGACGRRVLGGDLPATGARNDGGGGSGGIAGTGGVGGAGNTAGTAGPPPDAPACPAGVGNLRACTDEPPCVVTCGPIKTGRTYCACAGGYWSCPVCTFDPARWPYDPSCFSLSNVTACPLDPSDPTALGLPQSGRACDQPPCQPCGSSAAVAYRDATNTPKYGYCVCFGGVYSCAQVNQWPPSPPADAGAPDHPSVGSGSGGAGGTTVPEGTLLVCPSQAPSGTCSVDGQACLFPTKTCVCSAGNWACFECPATRPAIGDACVDPTDGSVPAGGAEVPPRNCQYANVTCSCPGTGSSWGCGICPPAPPPAGQACGNSQFRCAYADQNCTCGYNNAWTCGSPACPTKIPSGGALPCPGIFTCQYPKENQVCQCDGVWGACSCPVQPPASGSACGGIQSCAYGDQTCTCIAGTWDCPVSCPATRPTEGASCSSSLSCGFGNVVCSCANNKWSCS